MSVSTRLSDLRTATGTPGQFAKKVGDAVRTARTVFNSRERTRRIEMLQAAGSVGERPSDWQLVLGASHMMLGYILPSNIEFYEHYEMGHWWQQILRTLDEPSAMMDPIGLGISKEMIISHLIQVVHTSAGYDVVLLQMFDDGLADLRTQLEQLVTGTHPRQAAVEAILEQPEYPAGLLRALDDFESDPVAHWRVDALTPIEGCEERFEWGIETFGTPGLLFTYAHTLPETPTASLKAWWKGELVIPSPPSMLAAA